MNRHNFKLSEGPNMRYPGGYIRITEGVTDPSYYTIREILGDITEHDASVGNQMSPQSDGSRTEIINFSNSGDAMSTSGSSSTQILDEPAGGGRKRRKKKTRKKRKRRKRGGMDSQPPTPEWRPGQLPIVPPEDLPEFILPPPANTVTRRTNRSRAIERERAPPGMRQRLQADGAMSLDEVNERYRRSQRSYLRNLTGDLLERCTGSRCGLGGRRRKKTRKKKNRKRRTKKKSRKHKRHK